MNSKGLRVLLICFFVLTPLAFSNGEKSKTNKFREREASDDALGYPNMYIPISNPLFLLT